MPGVFFAHAEEDFPIVEALSARLESGEYSCWLYERDTIAGRSYLAQMHEAICVSDAMVAIVSQVSIGSQHVTREIELAYAKRKPIVPIFIDVTSSQLEQKNRSWCMAFGTTVRISMADLLPNVADRLLATLLELRIPKQPVNRSVHRRLWGRTFQSRHTPTTTTQWASDGAQIDVSNIAEMVYRTRAVDEFVNSDQKLFVCGTKGLGKTLLLKLKRHLLTEQHRVGRQLDVLSIPTDRPFLDMMTNLPSLSGQHLNFLAKMRNCKRLWAFAIRLSVISHIRAAADDLAQAASHVLPSSLSAWLRSTPVEPSVVFKQLLTESPKTINRLLDKLENLLDHAIRNVNRAAYVFIDKVDQGISDLPTDAWCNIQGGLLEAAWDTSSTNAHLKVFGTIREEAFANYQSQIKANVRGAVVTLKYDETELRRMIDSLTAWYEGASDFASFVQLSSIHNTRADIVEDSFKYLSRHTVGRPRDYVHLCRALSNAGEHLSEDKFRTIVNDEAAAAVVSTLLEEMSPFLDVLKQPSERARFFQMLPYNILTLEEVNGLSLEFNQLTNGHGGGPLCHEGFPDPFLELWSCGLIGTVDDGMMSSRIQRFKQPGESFRLETRQLPRSAVYLLHPSLHMVVKEQRAGDGYRVFKYIVVGHDNCWEDYNEKLLRVQRELFRLPKKHEKLRRAIDEDALPYVHSAWAEKKPIEELMPDKCRRRVDEVLNELDTLKYADLCEAMRVAWVDWGRGDSGSIGNSQTKSNSVAT
jgi:hypothetical protein